MIDGREIARVILDGLKQRTAPKRFLAAFFVAPDEATKRFLSQKKKIADSLGVDFRLYEFPAAIMQDGFRKEIEKVALGSACGGAIVQLPLPAHIDPQYVLNAVPREKDVDVLGERALGAFVAGRNPVLPTAVATVLEILSTLNMEPSDLSVAVVGLGKLVGKPVASHFDGKARNVFALDRNGDFSLLKQADVVVLGAGDPGIVTPEMLKDGALVVDFGYGTKNGPPSYKATEGRGKIMGDFDPGNSDKDVFYTPTPGGTGPVLVAKLFENFYALSGNGGHRKKRKFFPQ